MNIIREAVDAVGGRQKAAKLLGISAVAVHKMESRGIFPRTEYTGETEYAEILAKNSNKKFTKKLLLEKGNPKNRS
jgi:hypothetical protein